MDRRALRTATAVSFGNGYQAIESLERVLADFSKSGLKSLDNQAD
jgi:hypothetical protein